MQCDKCGTKLIAENLDAFPTDHDRYVHRYVHTPERCLIFQLAKVTTKERDELKVVLRRAHTVLSKIEPESRSIRHENVLLEIEGVLGVGPYCTCRPQIALRHQHDCCGPTCICIPQTCVQHANDCCVSNGAGRITPWPTSHATSSDHNP
jgi:hypothetical protein